MARSNSGRADALPANTEAVVLLVAAARTTAFDSGTLANDGGSQLLVILETTAIGTASLTVTISGVNPSSGTKYTLLAGTAVSTNLQTVYRISPHLTAAANLIAKDIVPARFNISVAVGNANPADFNLSYQLV